MNIILNYLTQLLDYIFLVSVYVYDVAVLQTVWLDELRENGFVDPQAIRDLQTKMTIDIFICLALATFQLLMTLYITAYHNVHMQVQDSEDLNTRLFYKVYARKYSKNLIRVMILEGVFLEIAVVILSSIIQHDLQTHLNRNTSNWVFVMNIIGSILEIIAAFADISIIWFEYDSQSSIVEKKLLFKNIFIVDKNWIYPNFEPDMELDEIAKIVQYEG